MTELYRQEIIGDCTINLVDARLIEVKADCVVTDPPYKLTSGGPSGLMRGAFDPEKYNNDGAIVACDIEWPEIMAIVEKSLERGHAYVMANNRNVEPMLTAGSAGKLEFHNLLVWDKITATPNRWYMKNCEFAGFFYKGKAKAINDKSSMQLIRCPQIDEADHPTEKPVALMEHWILNSTEPGDLVYDPFMGSGSTAVACIRTGRRFVGCEIDPKYFEQAKKRIIDANANFQRTLF